MSAAIGFSKIVPTLNGQAGPVLGLAGPKAKLESGALIVIQPHFLLKKIILLIRKYKTDKVICMGDLQFKFLNEIEGTYIRIILYLDIVM